MALEADRIKEETRTTRTLGDDDDGAFLQMNNASAITLTVPEGLPAGFQVTIQQKGAGKVTLAAGGTVTFQAPDSAAAPPEALEEGSTFGLTKVGAEVFAVYGSLG